MDPINHLIYLEEVSLDVHYKGLFFSKHFQIHLSSAIYSYLLVFNPFECYAHSQEEMRVKESLESKYKSVKDLKHISLKVFLFKIHTHYIFVLNKGKLQHLQEHQFIQAGLSSQEYL